MATIRNERDIQLQATTPRLLSIDSNYVTVIPSTTIFSTGASGIIPSSITILATFTGVLRGTVVWSSSPSVPMSISGNSVTINGSSVPVGTSVTVTATLSFLGVNYQSSTTITHAPITPVYKIISTANTITNNAGVFTPTSVQFLSRSIVSGEIAVYNGRFIISTSADGVSFSTLHTSVSDVSSYTYSPNASHKFIRARLYKAGGTSVLLDETTIAISTQSETDLSNVLLKNAANILTGTIVPQDSGALKVGGITWNSTTGALTGGTGIAITEWGLIGANAGVPKFTIESGTGNATFAGTLNAATGTFQGNITGGANIDITGSGRFNGNTSQDGETNAIVANSSKIQRVGVRSYDWSSTSGTAIKGESTSSGGIGVSGTATGSTGIGVHGVAIGSGRKGVQAQGFSGADALTISGNMVQTSGTSQLLTVSVSSGGLSVSGNITQSSGTSQLRSLTINSGGLTVSSGSTSVGALSCSTFSTSSTGLVTNLNSQYWGGLRTNNVFTGTATATFNGSNKPGSNSTNQWLRVTDTSGNHAYLPYWT